MSIYVSFEAEIRLYDDDVPDTLDVMEIQQAVQNVIGHTGATVRDVLDYEDDGVPRVDPDGMAAWNAEAEEGVRRLELLRDANSHSEPE